MSKKIKEPLFDFIDPSLSHKILNGDALTNLRKMDDEFFWEPGLYSGTSSYAYHPSIEELEKASYVVSYHKVENIVPYKRIGSFYIYKV